MKIRLFKYFLCNSKMYFMSICILTCEMFCLHRSSLFSFHHNTHTFQPFFILYKFLFVLFHFLIINIALSLRYLVDTSRLTRRFVTSRQMFSRVLVDTTRLSQYRIQLNCRDQWWGRRTQTINIFFTSFYIFQLIENLIGCGTFLSTCHYHLH